MSKKYINFATDMDESQFKLSKLRIVSFFIICGGLYYLTSSFLMSLGIMILLIIANYLLAAWIGKKMGKEEEHL